VRVGIDAHALGSNLGGNETYTRNLIRGLGKVDPEGDYTLLLSAGRAHDPIVGSDTMRRAVVRPDRALIRVPFVLPLALARNNIDLVHVQYVAPPLCPSRIVVTVHDIAYDRYPQYFTRKEVLRFRLLVPSTVRRAAVVLTVSEYARRELIARYLLPPDKVVVAPNAVDPVFRPIDDPHTLDAVKARYGTGGRYILCVGNLQPRKNVRTLIDAYVRLRRSGVTRAKLVLVGKAAWLSDDIFAAARDSGYMGDLVFTGYVPAADLAALYSAAAVFVYPSFYEGFGLPPLEAMACGSPVVCSNAGALPEVVGQAALTVDPYSAAAIAAAVARVLMDSSLRETLRHAGHRRASSFTAESSAAIVFSAYRTAMQT